MTIFGLFGLPFFIAQKGVFSFQNIIKDKKLKKSKNCLFSKGVNPWFWFKNGHFSNFFFQAIQDRQMTFTTIQSKKTPFQAIETRSSKSRKIDIFPKGVNPWLWSKNGHFCKLFFLGNIGKENVFHDILEQKKASLGFKNKKFKTSKN